MHAHICGWVWMGELDFFHCVYTSGLHAKYSGKSVEKESSLSFAGLGH